MSEIQPERIPSLAKNGLIEIIDSTLPFNTDILEKGYSIAKYCVGLSQNSNLGTDLLEEISNLHKLSNLLALLTISSMDLMVVSKNLYVSRHTWELVHFIKNGYLVIYETINTYHKYRQSLYEMILQKVPKMAISYDEVSKEIKSFKKEFGYQKEMSEIRNIICGHISDDFVLYYDTVLKLNTEVFCGMVIKFVGTLRQLQNLIYELNLFVLNSIEIQNRSK